MPRYKLIIEYDGTPYVGWQIQKQHISVQGQIAKAFKAFTKEDVKVFGAGRTDTGVHALGQAIHVDLEKDWDAFKVVSALNYMLKSDAIAALSCEKVAADFDVRFSAVKRHYLYRIITRRAPLVLEKNRAWQVYRPLNIENMHEAAQCLIGEHDFTAFRSSHCQALSPIKSIDEISIFEKDGVIESHINARSFMHHQVRSIMGCLKMVGDGEWAVPVLNQVLQSCDRTKCAPLAPSCGLYLSQIDYPD